VKDFGAALLLSKSLIFDVNVSMSKYLELWKKAQKY
jgi:hypothetical protein